MNQPVHQKRPESSTFVFETDQWVPFPVELVFAFFANPANLPYLSPSRLRVHIEDMRLKPAPGRPRADDPARRFQSVAAGEGSEVMISLQPLAWVPRRIGWQVRVTEFAWNSHFCDEQVRGPFAHFVHRHGIEADWSDGVEGTMVSDRVEFALGAGWLGRLATLVVQRQMRRQFAHRQLQLPRILAAAASQAARRR
jgi:ligand-binding SRPBCC domain-containing protein